MKTIITILLCLMAGLSIGTTLAEETIPTFPVFPASDIKSIRAKEGQKITVTGFVSGTHTSKGGAHFIHFQDSDFYLVTFKSDLPAFEEGEPADLYSGKQLAVTGVVSLYQKKPQMILSHPDMTRIIQSNRPAPDAEKGEDTTTSTLNQTAAKVPKKSPEKEDEEKKNPPVDSKKYFK